jgi:hypothetical protein
MAKYSFEFEKKVLQAYLDGKGGYVCLAKQYNSSHVHRLLRRLFCEHAYNTQGVLFTWLLVE